MICINTNIDHEELDARWFAAIFYEGYDGQWEIVSVEVPA